MPLNQIEFWELLFLRTKKMWLEFNPTAKNILITIFNLNQFKTVNDRRITSLNIHETCLSNDVGVGHFKLKIIVFQSWPEIS